MSIDELFAALEGGEALVRLARQQIYREQQTCPHPIVTSLGLDADEIEFERCSRCRKTWAKGLRPKPATS